MVVALGALVANLKVVGAAKAAGKLGKFGSLFTKVKEKMGPQLANLSKKFGQFGMLAGGVFGAMIASSPRLRAQMAMMGLAASRLVRIFADALVPVFRAVTDAIRAVYDWFTNLPGPVQAAIVFGVALAVVLGLVAGAFSIIVAAASPVLLIFLALIALAAALHLAFSTNFLGFQDFITGMFGNIVGIFEGIIEFFSAIFKGDLEGALKAIMKVFENIVDGIITYVWFIPQALIDIVDFLTGGLLTDFINAGFELVEGFFKAIADAISGVGGWIGGLLELVADFFGGSLPERGPLKNIVQMGEDLGVAYVRGVGAGISQSTTNARTLNVRNLSLTLNQAPRDSRSLLRGLSKDVRLRRASTW